MIAVDSAKWFMREKRVDGLRDTEVNHLRKLVHKVKPQINNATKKERKSTQKCNAYFAIMVILCLAMSSFRILYLNLNGRRDVGKKCTDIGFAQKQCQYT